MINVTEAAANKIKSLMEGEGRPDAGLRVAVMGGGCSGFQYNLAFENQSGELDQVFETEGVRLFVDVKSCLYLNGVTLDYSDGLMGAGFKIENPNANRTCGCGTSVSA